MKKEKVNFERFFTCDCGTETLKFDYDTAFGEYFLYITLFGYYGSVSGFRIIKEKIKNFFAVLFGKECASKTVVCLSKEKMQDMLKFLEEITGNKPKKLKKVGLFSAYFPNSDGFNLLLVEPDLDGNCFDFWMCPNYLFWGKKTRWAKAWKVLKDGTWTISSIDIDPDSGEIQNLMDYLYTMLKIDWEKYVEEK